MVLKNSKSEMSMHFVLFTFLEYIYTKTQLKAKKEIIDIFFLFILFSWIVVVVYLIICYQAVMHNFPDEFLNVEAWLRARWEWKQKRKKNNYPWI